MDLRGKFAAAVAAILTGTYTSEDSKELLRRITAISKGRYAQRLAAHIETLNRTDLLPADDTRDRADSLTSSNTARLLLNSGRAGYILAALDRISWMVRGHSLLLDTSTETTDQSVYTGDGTRIDSGGELPVAAANSNQQ